MHEYAEVKVRNKKTMKDPKKRSIIPYLLAAIALAMLVLLLVLLVRNPQRLSIERKSENAYIAALYKESSNVLNQVQSDVFGNKYIIKEMYFRDDQTYT